MWPAQQRSVRSSPGLGVRSARQRASANTSKSDQPDEARFAAARSRDVARSVAVDRLMRTFGRSSRGLKPKAEMNLAAHDLGEDLLEVLAAEI